MAGLNYFSTSVARLGLLSKIVLFFIILWHVYFILLQQLALRARRADLVLDFTLLHGNITIQLASWSPSMHCFLTLYFS